MKKILKLIIFFLIIIIISLMWNKLRNNNYNSFSENDKIVFDELSKIYREFQKNPEKI